MLNCNAELCSCHLIVGPNQVRDIVHISFSFSKLTLITQSGYSSCFSPSGKLMSELWGGGVN